MFQRHIVATNFSIDDFGRYDRLVRVSANNFKWGRNTFEKFYRGSKKKKTHK